MASECGGVGSVASECGSVGVWLVSVGVWECG